MIALTKASETHDTELIQEWDDAFGLSWMVWDCPECGYRIQLCSHPFQKLVLDPGRDALTPEIADESLRLRKEGRHAAANRLLASVPGHRMQRGGLEMTGVDELAN